MNEFGSRAEELADDLVCRYEHGLLMGLLAIIEGRSKCGCHNCTQDVARRASKATDDFNAEVDRQTTIPIVDPEEQALAHWAMQQIADAKGKTNKD